MVVFVLVLCHFSDMDNELIIHERGAAVFVKDPETGEVLAIEPDERYVKGIREFWSAECQHPDTLIMRVPIAGGSIQVRNCCTTCGERIGNSLPQKDVAWVQNLPQFLDDTSTTYKERRFAQRHAFLLQLARMQYAERGKFTEFYRSYFQSPEWNAKRELVFKRCGNVCEGCGLSPATEAHHLTYRHFGNELLFELLGLCHACHERIHAEDRELTADNDDELAGTEFKGESDDSPFGEPLESSPVT